VIRHFQELQNADCRGKKAVRRWQTARERKGTNEAETYRDWKAAVRRASGRYFGAAMRRYVYFKEPNLESFRRTSEDPAIVSFRIDINLASVHQLLHIASCPFSVA
jgi:hypothetical protein